MSLKLVYTTGIEFQTFRCTRGRWVVSIDPKCLGFRSNFFWWVPIDNSLMSTKPYSTKNSWFAYKDTFPINIPIHTNSSHSWFHNSSYPIFQSRFQIPYINGIPILSSHSLATMIGSILELIRSLSVLCTSKWGSVTYSISSLVFRP